MSEFEIRLDKIGKRYNNDWIFKDVDLKINKGDKIAILGYNGSGKSTLLQIIAGYVTPSKGSIHFYNDKNVIEPEHIYKHISFASPYLDLIEDFTLTELFNFHSSVKPFHQNLTLQNFISIAELTHTEDKPIRNFSSGMKQRLKLALAFLCEVDGVFLDEPLTNLDAKGIQWYKDLIENYADGKTVIVCSNNSKEETFFCKSEISILNYKK